MQLNKAHKCMQTELFPNYFYCNEFGKKDRQREKERERRKGNPKKKCK